MFDCRLIACYECDLLQRKVVLPQGASAHCQRCGARLYRYVPRQVDRTLALTCAAAVMFILANCYPIAGLSINGTLIETTLSGAAMTLYRGGMWPLAGLVVVTTLLMPLITITAVIALLAPMRFGCAPRRPELIFRVLRHIAPWGMIEVLMLGMLVALVKLQHIATIVPGIAIWACGAVTLLLAAAASSFDVHQLWLVIDTRRGGLATSTETIANARATTAGRAGLLVCRDCGLLSTPALAAAASHCPRCRTKLHFRQPNSLARTWAFVIAAIVLYVPAVLLPVMVTGTLFGTQSDTLISGIVFLWRSGSWGLAIIVLIASVAVPILKILSLAYLAASTQYRSRMNAPMQMKIYRFVDCVGRWSMLDIYVITLLVALVKFGGVATIDAGPGAVAFGAVVVLTLFAALAFDPRLIWNALEQERE
jgi:paraquat-inducible protein A